MEVQIPSASRSSHTAGFLFAMFTVLMVFMASMENGKRARNGASQDTTKAFCFALT